MWEADGYDICAFIVQLKVQNAAHFSVSNRQTDNRNRALEIHALLLELMPLLYSSDSFIEKWCFIYGGLPGILYIYLEI